MGALMERKVSEITSRRSHGLRLRAKHAIQAAFIWGSAATLLKPLSTKVGTGWLPVAKLCPLCALQAVVEKDLVHDQRQAMLAAQVLRWQPVPHAG